MTALAPDPDGPLARALDEALAAARWEIADVLARRGEALAPDLIDGRAAELALSTEPADQLLARVLEQGARDLRSGKRPLARRPREAAFADLTARLRSDARGEEGLSEEALRRPTILLSEQDHRLLQKLAIDLLLERPRTAAPLLYELDRAHVVPADDLPEDVVRLGSWVDYVEGGRQAGRAQLVAPPHETEPDALSVLSPVGSALIGLSTGQTILWQDHFGAERLLTVREVR